MTTSTIREALEHSAKTFREYEALHAAKPDMVKAAKNGAHAEICEKALAHLDAIENEEVPSPDVERVSVLLHESNLAMEGMPWKTGDGKPSTESVSLGRCAMAVYKADEVQKMDWNGNVRAASFSERRTECNAIAKAVLDIAGVGYVE